MDTKKSFLLRVDPALWAELESWAAAELRSINGQVEYLLREAVLKRKGQIMKNKTPGETSPGSGKNT
jgi:hypothetical protein